MPTRKIQTEEYYEDIKRDNSGDVQFVSVASGLTASQSGTITTTPNQQAKFIQAQVTLGPTNTLDTPSLSLKVNGGNTWTTSVAAASTNLTTTYTFTLSVTSPSLTADATVAGGTGTLTVTWLFEDRIALERRA